MSAPQETANEKAAEDLFESVCAELASGRQRKQLIRELVHQGWTNEAAKEFVSLGVQALQEQRNSPKGREDTARRAMAQMQMGGYWLLGGGAWMFGSQLVMAAPNSSIQLISYMAMIYGGVELVSGLITWWPLRELTGPQGNVTIGR